MSGERGCTWDNLSLWCDELAMGRGESWKRRTTRVRHDEHTFSKTFPEYRVREAECVQLQTKRKSRLFSEEKIMARIPSTRLYSTRVQRNFWDEIRLMFWHN